VNDLLESTTHGGRGGAEPIDQPAADEGQQQNIAVRTEPSAVAVFNPLDAQPVAFKRALVSRSENYDALAMHLRGMLVPDKDFGRIHIAGKSKCAKPWDCSHAKQPYHWSPYMLFAAGADKVLGMLGLTTQYPGEQDFIRAALSGKQIQDVIMKCLVLASNDTVIAEGMGACGRSEVQNSLNNAIKRACKRARVDAVLRLPAISALFEDDFLGQVDRDATKQNSTSSRQQQVNNKYNDGVQLEAWPFQKPPELVGVKFRDMKDETLNWIASKILDKPDIRNAAVKELERRSNTPPNSGPESSPPPAELQKSEQQGNRDKPVASAQGDHTNADWLREYEDTAEWEKK